MITASSLIAAAFPVNTTQARSDMHGMAAETPGDSPFPAACTDEKGEAQQIT